MQLIVKTPLGLERVVASRIAELEPSATMTVKPRGLEGLIVIESCYDKKGLLKKILDDIPEVESAIPVEAEVKADPDSIAKEASRLAMSTISKDDSFAVRTVRRGRHDFTSIDINVRAGSAISQATGACVNLDFPDKVVRVEIIFDRAAIAILDGKSEWKKMGQGKRMSTFFFNRVSVVQMPYLGSKEGAREIGARIGRAVQAYEVRELVIAPNKPVDAFEMSYFIEGVREGIESRYKVQKRSYGRELRRVPVTLYDIYQLVRERRHEPLIVFEPEGLQVRDSAEKLVNLMSRSKRVNFFFGSREGVPKGIYRIADMVIDLAPGVTLPTELAAPVALTAVYTALNMANMEL